MFKFEIERVDFLSAARIWCLTGKLLDGKIFHHSTAFVETESGVKKVKIETVAFIDSSKSDGHLTLTVSGDEKILADLKGKLLASTLPEPALTV